MDAMTDLRQARYFLDLAEGAPLNDANIYRQQARLHAQLAQADALIRIAEVMETFLDIVQEDPK